MSILGYFESPQNPLRLEKDKAGFGTDGVVLEGKKSVELARALEVSQAALGTGPNLPVTTHRPARPEWVQLEDYDPVLRAHCRLDREG